MDVVLRSGGVLEWWCVVQMMLLIAAVIIYECKLTSLLAYR
jgi:hypothetical protein